MKKIILKAYKHPLFASSALMVIGSNAASFLNYVYHLVIGRLLSPAQYGELSALFSLINLIGIIPQSFNLLIVKFISEAEEKRKIKGLINWFSKRIMIFTVISFILICIFSSPIAQFLNIENNYLIILTGLTFVFSLQSFLNRSILQGLLNFKAIIISMLIENIIKLASSAALVYLGFALFGAIGGVVIAAFIALLITRNYLKDYRNFKEETPPQNTQILKFSLPVAVQSMAAASFISSDLILVKHFFSPEQAGLYAAVATLGKIVFFATGPVSSVMLPLIAKQKSTSGQNKIFLLAFAINLFITLSAAAVFYFLPNLIVYMLYGSSYLLAANYLAAFGLFMVFYTLATLFINYFLMLNKTWVVYLSFAAALAQIIGIYFYHDNLTSVITISSITAFILTISLAGVFLKEKTIPAR